MKEDKKSSVKKFLSGNGFYIILAACLLAVGAAGFFAVSNLEVDNNNKKNNQNSSEYNDPGITYSSNVPSTDEPVQQEVKDEPKNESSKSESTTAKPKEIVFSKPVNGDICKAYDEKTLQYSATYNDMRIHLGTDISADAGSDVAACADGVVSKIYNSDTLGRVIEIDHGDGIVIKYCGVADDITVQEGQSVTGGTKLATVSGVPSESADPPHIHIEVTKSGKAKDPAKVLKFDN